MSARDFLSVDDVNPEELWHLVDDARHTKEDRGHHADALTGKHVALLFEKPSTRTRVSFEIAIDQLGGDAVILRSDELQLGRGETLEDTAVTLSRYVDAIVVRTFGQDRLERLAYAASVPVINALSDFIHPCQCLADLLTILEKKGTLQGVSVAYLGDGNNVAHSLMFGGAKMGMDVRVATPRGYEPFPQVVERCNEISAQTGARVTVTDVVAEAVHGASVLYTDVWTSMGQDEEATKRREAFEHYRLDRTVVDMAHDDAIVMHCLPAHRGEEISAEVFDGPRSVVWDQAENRLYTQKALLAWLLSMPTA